MMRLYLAGVLIPLAILCVAIRSESSTFPPVATACSTPAIPGTAYFNISRPNLIASVEIRNGCNVPVVVQLFNNRNEAVLGQTMTTLPGTTFVQSFEVPRNWSLHILPPGGLATQTFSLTLDVVP